MEWSFIMQRDVREYGLQPIAAWWALGIGACAVRYILSVGSENERDE